MEGSHQDGGGGSAYQAAGIVPPPRDRVKRDTYSGMTADEIFQPLQSFRKMTFLQYLECMKIQNLKYHYL